MEQNSNPLEKLRQLKANRDSAKKQAEQKPAQKRNSMNPGYKYFDPSKQSKPQPQSKGQANALQPTGTFSSPDAPAVQGTTLPSTPKSSTTPFTDWKPKQTAQPASRVGKSLAEFKPNLPTNGLPSEAPSYSQGDTQFGRESAMQRINNARSIKDLEGLNVSNDPEVMDGFQRRMSSFQGENQTATEPAPNKVEKSFWENAVDGLFVSLPSTLGSTAKGISEMFDLASATPMMPVAGLPNQTKFEDYTQLKRDQAEGKAGAITPGLEGFADRKQAESKKIAEDRKVDDESWGFMTGSLVPQMAGIATAVAVGAVNPVAGAAIGYANVAALSSMAVGGAAQEYDEYVEGKNAALKEELGRRFPGSINANGSINKDNIPEEAKGFANEMQYDPNARLGAMALAAAAESISEAIPVAKFVPKAFRGKMSKLMFGNTEIASKKGAELIKEFATTNASRGQMVKNVIREMGEGALTEGPTEAFAELGGEVATWLYKEKEDRATWKELAERSFKAVVGGSIMGAGIGPMSYGAQQVQNKIRRKQSGKVILAQDQTTGEAVEIMGMANADKDGMPPTTEATRYQAIRPNGKIYEVDENQLDGIVEIPFQDFEGILKGKGEGQKAMEGQSNQQAAEEVNQEANSIREQYQGMTFQGAEGAQMISAGKYNGEDVYITSMMPDGSLVIQKPGEEKKVVPKGGVIDQQTMPFEDYMATFAPPQEAAQVFDPANPIQRGETVTVDGQKYFVTSVNMEQGMVQLENEGDESDLPAIPVADFQQFREAQQAEPEAKINEGANQLRDIFKPKEEVAEEKPSNEEAKAPVNPSNEAISPESPSVPAQPASNEQGGKKPATPENVPAKPDGQGADGQVQVGELKKVAGKDLKKIISEYESREGTDMSEFVDENIKDEDDYVLQDVDIEELLKDDPNIKEFIDSELENYKPNSRKITTPILLGDANYLSKDNAVIDGYSRVTQAVANKDKTIPAYRKVYPPKKSNKAVQVEKPMLETQAMGVKTKLQHTQPGSEGLYDANYLVPVMKKGNEITMPDGDTSFEISNDKAKVIGRVKGVDFPYAKPSDTRGEIFILESKEKGKGLGQDIMLEALYLMRMNDVETVKFTVPSKEGKPFNNALERKGYITKIQEDKETGTTEYQIEDLVVEEKYNEKINQLKNDRVQQAEPKPEAGPNGAKAQENQDVKQRPKEGQENLGGGGLIAPPVKKTEAKESTYEKARKDGVIEKDGVKYVRNKPIQSNKGAEVNLEFSKDVNEKANYVVIESSEIQPSHKKGQQNPLHFIPEAQPKNRKTASSQDSAMQIAQKLDPAKIAQSPNPYSGSPVVNSRGEVIQGNNRTDAIQQYWETNLKDASGYKQYLKDNAAQFGLNQADIDGMKNPVLVRMVSSSDSRAIELGNYDVKDIESGGARRIDPITTVNKMQKADRKALLNLLSQSNGETLAEIVRDQIGRITKYLYDKRMINSTQLETIINTTTGEVKPSGIEDISAIYKQFIFQGGNNVLSDLFNTLPNRVQKGIEKALPDILNAPTPILFEIQEAIMALNEFNASGVNSFSDWITQADMFKGGEAPINTFSKLSLELSNQFDNAKTQAEIAKLFREYNSLTTGTQGDLLSGPVAGITPQEAINKIFQIKDHDPIQFNGRTSEADLADKPAQEQDGAGQDEKPSRTGNEAKPEQGPVNNSPGTKPETKAKPGGSKGVGGNIDGGVVKKIVLDEGSGVVLNDIYDQWTKIKDEKGQAAWNEKVKNTKFGTYGTKPFFEVLDEFEPKLNEVTKKNFYKELESALEIPKSQSRYPDKKPIASLKELNEEISRKKPRKISEANGLFKPTDGKGISEGDVFETSTGRITTKFPKTSKRFNKTDNEKTSQWLIDNATAEAISRGDDFNEGIFSNTTRLQNGSLTESDSYSLNAYLFDESWKDVGAGQKKLLRPVENNLTPEEQIVWDEMANRKVPEGKGTWRQAFNDSKDPMRKSDILRGIIELDSSNKQELTDIQNVYKGMPGNIEYYLNERLNRDSNKQPSPPQEFTYLLTQRPPSIGTHPEGTTKNPEETTFRGRKAWKLTYANPLTQEQIDKFELSNTYSKEDIGKQWSRPFGKGDTITLEITNVSEDGTIEYKEFTSAKELASKETTFKGIDKILTEKGYNTKPEGETKQEYKFELLLRPFNQASYPKDAYIRWENIDGSKHGAIVLDRPLTVSEIKKYDVAAITQVDQIKGQNFVDKDGYYSLIKIDWIGSSYRFAKISQFDQDGEQVSNSFDMNATEILENIESGYWSEAKPKQTPKTKEVQVDGASKAKIGKDVDVNDLDASYRLNQLSQLNPMYKQGFRYEGIFSFPVSLGENGNYSDGNFYKEVPTEQKIIDDIKSAIKYELEQLSEEEYLSGREEAIKIALENINAKPTPPSAPEKAPYFGNGKLMGKRETSIGTEYKVKFIRGEGGVEIKLIYSDNPNLNMPTEFATEADFNSFKEKASKETGTAPSPPKAPTRPADYGKSNKVVSQKEADEAKQKLKDFFKGKGGKLYIGLDPEIMVAGLKYSAYHIEAGARKFADFVKIMVEDFGDGIAPYLSGFYEQLKRDPDFKAEGISKEMTPTDDVDNFDIAKFVEELTNNQEDVSDRPADSQRDSPEGESPVQNDNESLSGGRGTSGQAGTKAQTGGKKGNGKRSGGKGNSNVSPNPSGITSLGDLFSNQPGSGTQKGDTGIVDGRGNSVTSPTGTDAEQGGNADIDPSTEKAIESFASKTAKRLKQQKEAESIPAKERDLDNIRATLPMLLPEQQEDVFKAENRFFDTEKHTEQNAKGKGYLFTNGTGTGKTYTGLGIVKRFLKQGKKDILIITPSQTKVSDWIDDAKNLGIESKALAGTKDKGQGVSVTTFATFRANEALFERDFDLIVYDESHRIMEDKKGKASSTTAAHFKNSNTDAVYAEQRIRDGHPLGKKRLEISRASAKIQKELDGKAKKPSGKSKAELANELGKLQKERDAIQEKLDVLRPQFKEQAKQAVGKTKVVFLSATPFKEVFNLRYANGVLFDWGNETTFAPKSNGMSRVNPEGQFFMDNFGSRFEWKNNQLQQKSKVNPEAISMQEIAFNTKLQQEGVMSGRAIESDMDYQRHFPILTGEKSERFNEAVNKIFNFDSKEYDGLRDAARNTFFNGNYVTQLLESMKASLLIPRIEQHLELGRKLIIFHRRQQANIEPPFFRIINESRLKAVSLLNEAGVSPEAKDKATNILAQADAFEQEFKDLFEYEKGLDYRSAVEQFAEHFGDKIRFQNGQTSDKEKKAGTHIKDFNEVGGPVKIIMVQEESGKEGISLHDTSGTEQRVLISLSMPRSSTTALQIEGRSYRIGVSSNVPYEYPILGMDFEIAHFASGINKQVSTTENLSLGDSARDLLNSFVLGIQAATDEAPNTEQGIGGKEQDKRYSEERSQFKKAMLYYQSNQKTKGRRDQREGVDFYATPEPIGQKMVEFLGLDPMEKVLEPSAGKGAIAMWFPGSTNRTVIEMSMGLFGKLSAVTSGANQENMRFEDHNIINKYHGVAMNPPFGSAGKTAMDHVEKAIKHLYDGGRVVALVPRGQMDKRVDAFMESKDAKNIYIRARITLPESTFEQAGTKVNTQIIVFDKIEKPVNADFDSGTYEVDLSSAKTIDELFERIEFIDVPDRVEVQDKKKVMEELTGIEDADSQDIKEVKAPVINNSGEVSPESFQYTEKKHTTSGEILHYVDITGRLPKEIYDNQVKERLPKFKGWFDRYNKMLRFKTKEGAEAFIQSFAQADPDSPRAMRVAESTQTDTKAFKDWFGDSKMVNEDGSPMVVYHGTNRDFNEFRSDVGSANDDGFYGKGFYFTFNSDPKWQGMAKNEAGYYGNRIMEAYVKAENPFDFSSLSNYKGQKIRSVGYESIVFLKNIAEKFPKIGKNISLRKQGKYDRNDESYEMSTVSIDVLPKLFKKYENDVVIEDVYDDGVVKSRTAYLKSKVETVTNTDRDGKEYSWESVDDLGRYSKDSNLEEIKLLAIIDAIEKYDGIKSDLHPEGYMTRNPQITEAIKAKGHDSIVQSMDGDEIVIFSPTQIKSATGNQGTFDGTNPDIRAMKPKSLAELNQMIDGERAQKMMEKPSGGKTNKAAEIAQKAADFTKTWNNAPKIVTLNSGKEARSLYPEVARTYSENDLNGIPALFLKNQRTGEYEVILFSSHSYLSEKGGLEKAILHEVIGHYGVRETLRKIAKGDQAKYRQEYEKVMLEVFQAKKGEKFLQDIIKKYFGKDASQLTDIEKMIAGDEYLAHVAQEGVQDKWIDRVVTKLRQILRRLGINLAISDAEIRTLLGNSMRLVAGPQGTVKLREGIDQGEAYQMRQENLNAQVINGFYSPIENKLLEFKQPKASANKWKEIVGKKDEAQWTGVYQYLDGLKPDQQVTKAELMDWMKANRVKIEVVEKGGQRGFDQEYVDDIYNSTREEFGQNDLMDELDGNTDNPLELFYANPNQSTLNDLISFADRYNISIDAIESRTDSSSDGTKFSQYQLEGDKTDYKEVLVTLPVKKKNQSYTVFKDGAEWKAKNNDTGEVMFGGWKSEIQAEMWVEGRSENVYDTQNNFKSGHFDEANILVHLRMNTRTDADGNKVLFMEEIQSDWGQKGKKEGFKEDAPKLTPHKQDSWDDNYKIWKVGDGNTPFVEYNSFKGDKPYRATDWAGAEIGKFETKEEAAMAANSGRYGTVPSAPFVTDTSSWVKLGLKVAMKEAVAQGADRIAWTTGTQQNDRYDLSKKVDGIKYKRFKKEDSTKGQRFGEDFYTITMLKDQGSQYEMDEIQSQNDIVESKLEDYVGKELAGKIISSKDSEKTLSSQDLQVGGKGMKSFYGDPSTEDIGIVGRVAESIVGKGMVQTTGINQGAKRTVEKWNDLTEEMEVIEYEARGDKGSTQHSIPVTPELIDQVESGLPMFMRAANTNSPDNIDIRAMKVEDSPATAEARKENSYQKFKNNVTEARKQKRYNYQDAMLPGKRMLEEAFGNMGEAPNSQDFYTKENLHKDKIFFLENQYKNKFQKPLKALTDNIQKQYGLAIEDIDNYLMAKHNLERRREIFTDKLGKIKNGEWMIPTRVLNRMEKELAEQIPDIKTYLFDLQSDILSKRLKARKRLIEKYLSDMESEFPSGMSQNEANEIMDSFENTVEQSESDELIERIQDINRESIRIRKEGGLLSEKGAEILENQYENYVPLRGLSDNIEEDETVFSPLMKANGRSSRASSPIAYLHADMMDAIAKSEHNKVLQSFLEFTKNNLSGNASILGFYLRKGEDVDGNEIWFEMPEGEKPTKAELANGTVKRGYDPVTMERAKFDNKPDDYALTVVVKGQKVKIRFEKRPDNLQMVAALKRTNIEKLSTIAQFGTRFNRILSRLFTAYSPEFGFVNMSRDAALGTFRILSMEGGKTYMSTMKEWPSALKMLYGAFNNNMDTEKMKDPYLKEYFQSGAFTGYNIQESVSEIHKQFKALTPGNKKGFMGNLAKLNPKGFKHLLETHNSAIENGLRLAFYTALRKQGLSVQKSAIKAKDLTVNFRRKGNKTNQTGAIYLFFNASVQGASAFIEPFDNKDKSIRSTAYGLASGMFGVGLAQGLALGLMGGDDDEENPYNNLSDYERNNHIIVPVGGGNFFKLPIGFGPNIPYAAGEMVASMLLGKADMEQTTFRFLSLLTNTFSPIGGYNFDSEQSSEQQIIRNLTPSYIKPAIDVAFNQNFLGYKIYPEKIWDKNKPDSWNFKKSTSETAKAIAQGLNTFRGGNEFESGPIDITPDVMEYYVRQYLGGPGYFIDKSIATMETFMKGENPLGAETLNKVPFVSRFLTNPENARTTMRKFYNAKNEVEELHDLYNKYENVGNIEKAKEKIEGKEGLLDAYEELKGYGTGKSRVDGTEKYIKDLNGQIEKATVNGATKEELEELEDQKLFLMQDFVNVYNEKNPKKPSRLSDLFK